MHLQFRVKKSERGKRLDAFLYEKMGTWSHKKIKQAIDKKRAFINGKNIMISGWNLKPNDRVEFSPSAHDQPENPEVSRYHYIQVLYEDIQILAVNKPAHIDYDSFVIQVNAYLKRIKGKGFYPYLGQMHRLDKETSGVLLFTKKKSANTLANQFRDRKIRKIYYALVAGKVPKEQGLIRAKLEKKKLPFGKKVQVTEGPEGKESHTEYWVEERYDKATLLKIQIGTGRTHQIRVHMAELGHPVLGDKLYGNEDSLHPKLKRQALHAARVIFTHPITGKKITIDAPLPPDLEKVIDALRLSA
jgi:23S rRNA pseudouridine1911/1915/1917 synthase